MFVGRNRKFEYASNTAGHRLWWVFIKKLEAEKIPEQTFNIKGKNLAWRRRGGVWRIRLGVETKRGRPKEDTSYSRNPKTQRDRDTTKKTRQNRNRKNEKPKIAEKKNKRNQKQDTNNSIFREKCFWNLHELFDSGKFFVHRKHECGNICNESEKQQRPSEQAFEIRWQIGAGQGIGRCKGFRPGAFLQDHSSLSQRSLRKRNSNKAHRHYSADTLPELRAF